MRPTDVDVHVEVDPARDDRFRGEVTLALRLERRRRSLLLHARDLRVSRARVVPGASGGEAGARRGRVIPHPEREAIEIAFDAPVPAGEARLELAFAGRLRKDLCGLYAAQVGQRRYAFTQLEAADARKFFPCLDEPAMKARFRLSVTTGATNAAVSNSPAERIEEHADGRKTIHFARTPLLSSYLVALAVGELESSEPVFAGATEIRVWHVPGKSGLAGFALEAARETLERLERYFDLPYPYAKLDLVAVPDFEFGAMENAGAVFFRETLLLTDPETVTLAEKKRAAEVICHELAHMWYGDLVTMAWWDDLWLNEAFATWMAFTVVDQWKPEWKMWHDFQHHRAAAFDLDALRHTHPVYTTVRTPEDAAENFDAITYEKGASVVRMIERYLGAEAFREGVRRYIRRHRESNAVAADLWSALAEASGEPVERVVRAWIEQEGYPLVRVRTSDGAALELAQERFFEQAPHRTAPRPRSRWPVPWVGRAFAASGEPEGRLVRHLLTRARERLPLEPPGPDFVYGNADEGGFYRPLHTESDLLALVRERGRLSAVERMGLLDHHWALVRAGHAPLASLLDAIEGFRDEAEPDVLQTLRRPLALLADRLAPDVAPACLPPLQGWVVRTFAPAVQALGWNPAPDEPDDTRLRRAALLALVGQLGESEEVLDAASRRCALYLEDRRSLDPNLADAVVAMAAMRGDEALFDAFLAAMREATTPQEHRRFLLVLAEFREPALVDRALALALTDAVATQDVAFLLVRLLHNPRARERAWAFVQRRWPRLRRRIAPLLASRVIGATPALGAPRHRREVARFFREHPVPAGTRALRQALERFDWYAGFRRRAGPELEAYLREIQASRVEGR